MLAAYVNVPNLSIIIYVIRQLRPPRFEGKQITFNNNKNNNKKFP